MNNILRMTFAGAVVFMPVMGQAAISTYVASDPTADPGGTFPNSTAEVTFFDAAVASPVSIVTFESVPVGQVVHLTIAPGVTMDGLDASGSPQEIKDTAPCGNVCGFNTTPGGANYLELLGGNITFNFDTTHTINAFGAFFEGVKFAEETIMFSDGNSQKLTLPGPVSGAQFFAFTYPGARISSITVNVQLPSQGDIIGIDDVMFVTNVTEPASLALLAVGLAGLGVARRRKII